MKDLKEVFEQRRSVNFFTKDKQIDQFTLENIINLAVLAPSAFNLQPWSIVAVKSPEAKRKLFNLSNQQQKVLDAPITLIICGDRDGYLPDNPTWLNMQEMGLDKEKVEGSQKFAATLYGDTPERKIKFAESNAGLMAMSLMYAAQYHGVDSHPMSGIDFDGIKKEFDIKHDVVMTIALGYFDQSNKLYPRMKRRGYKEIVKEV